MCTLVMHTAFNLRIDYRPFFAHSDHCTKPECQECCQRFSTPYCSTVTSELELALLGLLTGKIPHMRYIIFQLQHTYRHVEIYIQPASFFPTFRLQPQRNFATQIIQGAMYLNVLRRRLHITLIFVFLCRNLELWLKIIKFKWKSGLRKNVNKWTKKNEKWLQNGQVQLYLINYIHFFK